MGETRRDHLRKEPYRKPACQPKSVSEVAVLMRESLLARRDTEGVRPSMEELARPILLVKDYAGHAHSIKEALQRSGMHCHVCSLVDDWELALICEAAGAVQADVLIIDLRQFKDRGRNVLMGIGEEPHLRRVPLIILANAAADSEIAKDSGRHNLWRLNGHVDSEQCVTGLRSLLDLQMAILKLPPKTKEESNHADAPAPMLSVGNGTAAGIGGKIDWKSLCREVE